MIQIGSLGGEKFMDDGWEIEDTVKHKNNKRKVWIENYQNKINFILQFR